MELKKLAVLKPAGHCEVRRPLALVSHKVYSGNERGKEKGRQGRQKEREGRGWNKGN